MYRDPFNLKINTKVKRDIEELDKKISEEKKNPNYDRHKILRMEEQKLIQGLFSGDLNINSYGKYRSPW